MERKLGTQEERFQLLKEGFYLSSGSNMALVLFIHFIGRREKISPEDALSLYNNSYGNLNQEYKEELVKHMFSNHTSETQKLVYADFSANTIRPVSDYLTRKGIGYEDFNFMFMEELPQIEYFSKLDKVLGTNLIKTRENLNFVLDYILNTFDSKKQQATLKAVAAFVNCFDNKDWFRKLPESKQKNFKSIGERICKEALVF